MTETEHKHVRLDLASLVPLFFWVGFGAGVFFIPFSLSEFSGQGALWVALAVALTPPVNGIAAVVLLLCGFPAYIVVARWRAGYSVRLLHIQSYGAQQGAASDPRKKRAVG